MARFNEKIDYKCQSGDVFVDKNWYIEILMGFNMSGDASIEDGNYYITKLTKKGTSNTCLEMFHEDDLFEDHTRL